MKKNRVLYIATTSSGGSAFSLYHMVKGLQDGRYEPVVLLYTREHSYIEDRLAESKIKTLYLDQGRRPSAPTASPIRQRDIGAWLDARLGRRAGRTYASLKACYQFVRQEAPMVRPIVRVIRENQIDLVHVNNGLRHGKPGIIAARLTRTPCVSHVRMFDHPNRFDRLFARFVYAFVYISSAVADFYVDRGIPPTRGTIVHNAIDLRDFSPPAPGAPSSGARFDAASVRREFGWTSEKQIVGVVGRLDWWKGHEYFVQAIAEAGREIPTLRGLIVGEPQDTPANQEYYQKLLSLTDSLGLAEKVIFTGFRSDVPRLLSAMDVVVLSSSRPEPFGRVVIEGMAAGRPVVATAAGGVLDIIEDGINGLLVPPQDVKAMAAAIVDLVSNREQAEQMGLAARRRVEAKFTLQRQVSAIQQLYDGILDLPEPDHAATGRQNAGHQNTDREAPLSTLSDVQPGSN